MALILYVMPLLRTFVGLVTLLFLSGCYLKADLSGTALLPGKLVTTPGPLKIIRSSPLGSDPESYAQSNNILYFMASVPGNNNASYLTDGTESGTNSVNSINSFLPAGSKYRGTIGSVRIFHDSASGELWRSDGTNAGTYSLISTGDPNQMMDSPWMKLSADGTIGWWIDEWGRTLLQTDGTVAGTFKTDISIVSTMFNVSQWGVVPSGAAIVYENKGTNPFSTDIYVFDFATRTKSLLKTFNDRDAGRGDSYQDGSDKFYFTVHQWGVGNYMAVTDGTVAGTDQLMATVMMDYVLRPIGKIGSDVIYLGQTAGGTRSYKFYKTQGAGFGDWTELKDTGYTFTSVAWEVDFAVQLGSKIVVRFYDFNAQSVAASCPMWVTDGTAAGTTQIAGVPLHDPATMTYQNSTQQPFVFNNVLYFQGYDATNGIELWKYDGVTAPSVFADLNPGVANGIPVVDDIAWPYTAGVTSSYFVLPIKTASNGVEPYISNGTVAGTHLLKDVAPGSMSSLGETSGISFKFYTVSDDVIFKATTEENGIEYWKTDGTEVGTRVLASLNDVPGPSDMTKLQVVNGKIYFAANNGVTGVEPWISDGTETGTHLLADIDSSVQSSSPTRFVNYNGDTYFLAIADNSLMDSKTSLWKTDGTSAGTSKIAHQMFTWASDIASFSSGLFMVGNEATNGREPWMSNGTLAGTQIVKNIATGTSHSMNSSIDWLQTWNGKILFAPNRGGTIKIDPWVSDGSSGGTGKLVGVNDAGGGSRPKAGLGTSQWFYFWADDATAGYELFKTDGTSVNTSMVKDINVGAGDAMIYADTLLGTVGDKLIFQADDGVNGQEIWVSDGSSAGTILLKDFSPGTGNTYVHAFAQDANFVYLTIQPDGENWELWKTDGTSAGTVRIYEFVSGESGDPDFWDMTTSNGYIFFSMCESTHGCEIWRSDGTASGTSLYWDATAGAIGTKPRSFIEYNSEIYFIGSYLGGGETIWKVNPLVAPE